MNCNISNRWRFGFLLILFLTFFFEQEALAQDGFITRCLKEMRRTFSLISRNEQIVTDFYNSQSISMPEHETEMIKLFRSLARTGEPLPVWMFPNNYQAQDIRYSNEPQLVHISPEAINRLLIDSHSSNLMSLRQIQVRLSDGSFTIAPLTDLFPISQVTASERTRDEAFRLFWRRRVEDSIRFWSPEMLIRKDLRSVSEAGDLMSMAQQVNEEIKQSIREAVALKLTPFRGATIDEIKQYSRDYQTDHYEQFLAKTEEIIATRLSQLKFDPVALGLSEEEFSRLEKEIRQRSLDSILRLLRRRDPDWPDFSEGLRNISLRHTPLPQIGR